MNLKSLVIFLITIFFLFPFISDAQSAEMQLIHNAADPALDTVDIYVDGVLTIDDFSFRSATTFITLNTGVTVNLGVALSNSLTVNDTVRNFQLNLQDTVIYAGLLSGLLSPANFLTNPDGRSTALSLTLKENVRKSASSAGNADFFAFHGVTDLPGIDIAARTITTFVFDAKYSDTTGYITVPAASYLLDITSPGGLPILSSYSADFSTLGDSSFILFVSGFQNPVQNMNGEALGLYAAFTDGTVLALPSIELARLQMIHNSADPSLDTVDVYLNGSLLLDDFVFRTATGYMDISCDQVLSFGVAPANSSSVNDTLKNFDLILVNGQTYVAVFTGVMNPALFAANPDGTSTAFSISLQGSMAEFSPSPTDMDVVPFHGSTDAAALDLLEGSNIMVDDITYKTFLPFISVPASTYYFDLTPGNNNQNILHTYYADFTNYGGVTSVILASGFMNPAANQNGAAFGLLVVISDGSAYMLSDVTGIEQKNILPVSLYPNPAHESVTARLEPSAANGEISIINQLGQITYSGYTGNNVQEFSLDLSAYKPGIYTVKVVAGKSIWIGKLMIQ